MQIGTKRSKPEAVLTGGGTWGHPSGISPTVRLTTRLRGRPPRCAIRHWVLDGRIGSPEQIRSAALAVAGRAISATSNRKSPIGSGTFRRAELSRISLAVEQRMRHTSFYPIADDKGTVKGPVWFWSYVTSVSCEGVVAPIDWSMEATTPERESSLAGR